MANRIFIPFLNPVKFVELEQDEVPQYLTKHFDDYLYYEALRDTPWLQQEKFFQKWQQSDKIRFQFESNFDPINISLVDAWGVNYVTVAAQNVRSNKYEPGLYVYEAEISLAAVPEGCFFLKLECGAGLLVMVSEPLSIKEKHENTTYIEYKHSRYFADVIFETGIEFTIRVDGIITGYRPGGSKSLYEDDKANPTVLKSRPVRNFTFAAGNERGIPDWLIDKLNWITGCDQVRYDDKYFSVFEEDAFEVEEEDGYPLKSLNIKLREGINRASRVMEPTGNIEQRLVVVYNIERRLFGDVDGDGSNNTIPILNIE